MPKVVLCFGPPYAGTTSVLCVLQASSEKQIVIVDVPVTSDNFQSWLEKAVDTNRGAEWLLVDFPQGLIGPADIEAAFNAGAIDRVTGVAVRVEASTEACHERARAVNDSISDQELLDWRRDTVQVEERIRFYQVRYVMINNDSLEHAVTRLANALGIRE